MTGEEWMDAQVAEHRKRCEGLAHLLNETDGDALTGAMVSDVLAIAGLHLVPMMVPPFMLFQEAYCKERAE